MADEFEKFQTPTNDTLTASAMYAAAVTPADGADLATSARALFVGTGGNVKITTVGGSVVTFENIQDGSILPVRAARVWSTGTTATKIVAMW